VSARLLDGKAIAAEITDRIAAQVPALPQPPGLAVILVGADPASEVYVRNKGRTAARLGFHHRQINLPADTPEAALLAEIAQLNADPQIHGILVQLPLPAHVRADAVIEAIDPAKDVDGFHPVNTGRLWQRRPALVPCTPAGVIELLLRSVAAPADLRGREAVVIGRSNIVGRPMVALLEHRDCTVTLCHSRTRDLAAHVARADIVVAAVGVPGMVKGAWIKEGATVLDVGINRLPDGKLTGDVEFAPAAERAAWITPVPGGVGPMTIALLMQNTYVVAGGR
jgi:methylenetetrahydrofolate dehydrogenase (NADP+)/methenyltetrahydrofolate cyclohydrolase